MALLAEYVDKEDPSIRIGAIMGLGLAYAGAQSEQVMISASSVFTSIYSSEARLPLNL